MMDDLISRQAAIDALRECQTYLFNEQDPDKKISLKSAEYAIEDLLPAEPDDAEANYWHEKANSYEQTLVKLAQSMAEHPEIIRCKDCRFYPNHGHKKDVVFDADACHWNTDEMPDPDDYCSAAERREE